jgi:hypothetical protein
VSSRLYRARRIGHTIDVECQGRGSLPSARVAATEHLFIGESLAPDPTKVRPRLYRFLVVPARILTPKDTELTIRMGKLPKGTRFLVLTPDVRQDP